MEKYLVAGISPVGTRPARWLTSVESYAAQTSRLCGQALRFDTLAAARSAKDDAAVGDADGDYYWVVVVEDE